MPGHGHRATILDRYPEDFGPAGGVNCQFVTKGGAENRGGRTPIAGRHLLGGINLRGFVYLCAGGEEAILGIFDIVGELPGLTIKPHVPDHAMDRGVRAGGERGMAHDGLRVGVCVMGVGIPDAVIHEIAEPALAHILDKSPRQVAPQLVHGNLQDEPGCRLNGVACRRQRFGNADSRGDQRQHVNEHGGEEVLCACGFHNRYAFSGCAQTRAGLALREPRNPGDRNGYQNKEESSQLCCLRRCCSPEAKKSPRPNSLGRFQAASSVCRRSVA